MRARASLLVAVLALWAPSVAAAQNVREVAARVHDEGGYGDRLRVGEPGGASVVYGGGSSGGSDREPAARERSEPSLRVPLGAGSAAVSYALVAVAIVAIVVLLVTLLVRLRPREGALAAPPSAIDRRSKASPSLPGRTIDLDADPEALAAEGRFAEAIAAALVRGLLAVGWRPEGHGKGRTAREILASVSDPRQRRALGELVAIEERVAFGGDDATCERWERARAELGELDGAHA